MARLSLSVLEAIFYKLGMEDDLNMFIRFRSVSSDFLDLAHRVGAPIKFNYHYLEALSYHRLFPITTLALSPKNVTLSKKISKAFINTDDNNLYIKADHLQTLKINVGHSSSVQVNIDVQSTDKLVLNGYKVFFPLKFPVKKIEINSACDVSFLNLEHVEKLYIKNYSVLSGVWPVLPCLKYLEAYNQVVDMSTFFFPNLRRLKSGSKNIFRDELLLIHSVSALDHTSGPGYDLYLTRDASKVSSKENIIYLIDRVEEQDILLTNKKNVRFFADEEITPRIRNVVETLSGQAKIYLRGQIRIW